MWEIAALEGEWGRTVKAGVIMQWEIGRQGKGPVIKSFKVFTGFLFSLISV